jgi:hypothetical protein
MNSEITQVMEREFKMDKFDVEDLERQLARDNIGEHVYVHALAEMLDKKKRGDNIASPKGLFIYLVRNHRHLPPANARNLAGTSPGPNPLAGDGYDFWLGDRELATDVCRDIIWGFDSDEPLEQKHALRKLNECAPALEEHELNEVLTIATDYDDRYGIEGSYPLRLATATRHVLGARVSSQTG